MKERIGVGKACYNYDHYCGKSNHVEYEKIKKRYECLDDVHNIIKDIRKELDR